MRWEDRALKKGTCGGAGEELKIGEPLAGCFDQAQEVTRMKPVASEMLESK